MAQNLRVVQGQGDPTQFSEEIALVDESGNLWTPPGMVKDSDLDAAVTAKINTPGSDTATALSATILDRIKADAIPKWKATTAYAAGEAVLNPSGDTVTAIAAFTSGASYDAANWKLSTSFATKYSYERRRDGLEAFDAGKLVKWRTAYAAVKAGTADAKILCVGDSTTQGLLGTPNGGITNSYPYRLARFLDDAGLNASRGLSVPGSTNNEDNRYALGTSWARTQTGFYGFGGTALYHFSGAAQGNVVYTDPAMADRYDVYYLRGTSNGTLTATATGGAATPQSTAGASGVFKFTVSAGAPATNNVLTVTSGADGDCWIIGIEPWLSTEKQVRLGNAGVGSSRAVTHWGGTDARGSSSAIKAYAPDLTIISLGINDGSSNHTIEQFSAAMDVLITAAQVTGDVILMAPIPVGDTWPTQSTKDLVPVFTAWMRARGLPFYNLPSRWNNGNDSFARGWMLDGVHPNQHGYEDLARGFVPGLLGGLTWLP